MSRYFMGGTQLDGLERMMMDPSRSVPSSEKPRRSRPRRKRPSTQPGRASITVWRAEEDGV